VITHQVTAPLSGSTLTVVFGQQPGQGFDLLGDFGRWLLVDGLAKRF
jgi:hypothetical protein